MHFIDQDTAFMTEAFKQARKALEKDEVPVGAVVVHQGKVISRAYNQVEMLKDPTAHAEMIAITQATNYLQQKWLSDCSIYVTIEPCSMCAGALVLARIKEIIYGAADPKTGACGSVIDIVNNSRLNHQIDVRKGVLARECAVLLSQFFQEKRAKGKK